MGGLEGAVRELDSIAGGVEKVRARRRRGSRRNDKAPSPALALPRQCPIVAPEAVISLLEALSPDSIKEQEKHSQVSKLGNLISLAGKLLDSADETAVKEHEDAIVVERDFGEPQNSQEKEKA
ncbi:hypothetical protein JCM11641_007585 [Rhodosporidiobolus odoratus]